VFTALYWTNTVTQSIKTDLRTSIQSENDKLKQDIEKSDSAIEKLFASMIHEFRGPINSMICNLELLEVATKG
jgi:signal transduction histidine kinase